MRLSKLAALIGAPVALLILLPYRAYLIEAQLQRSIGTEAPATTPADQPTKLPLLLDKTRLRETLTVTLPADVKALTFMTPSAVSYTPAGEQAEGVFHFAKHPVIEYRDRTFRPTSATEDRQLRFAVQGKQVNLEAEGNYVVLPAQAVYALYDFALKKKDSDATKALERVVGQVGSTGTAVYRWSDEAVEFVIYDQFASTSVPPKYRGTVTFIEGVKDLRDKMGELTAGYYWLTAAKYSTSLAAKERLTELATRTLPKDAVIRFLSER